MIIHTMTATFGKLEHETLTLRPGLNVIYAPNEWGKSTWCTFLTAMLYGLDTKSRSTGTALSDKERYSPWSGAPMSGSMEITWQGRRITLQRKTKGRALFGDFRAFETESGLPVPELTAANCGQMLLGVEKSVFLRSAFLRLPELPVTQDPALRARLNALVTTGDESNTAQALEQKLKELRNRCRYNRSGLLPQAEAEAAALEQKLTQLHALEARAQSLRQEQKQAEQYLLELQNHQNVLLHNQAQQEAERIRHAKRELDRAEATLAQLEAACAQLMPEKEADAALHQLDALQEKLDDLLRAEQALDPVPLPELPAPLSNSDVWQALESDLAQYKASHAPWFLLPLVPGLLCLAAALLWLPQSPLICWLAGGLCLLLGMAGIWLQLQKHRTAQALIQKYGSRDPAHWRRRLEHSLEQQQQYQRRHALYTQEKTRLESLQASVQDQIHRLCGDQSPQSCRKAWTRTLRTWDARKAAWDDREQNRRHMAALRAMAQKPPVTVPLGPDRLTLTEQRTDSEIQQITQQLQQLHSKLGQCQGQMGAIGHGPDLDARLSRCRSRIQNLTQTYDALTLALETLEQARRALQRRFAPRITQRAQAILHRLTEGRYCQLRLAEDLSLQAAAAAEDTLRPALWRSDGTMDQLYLALRLAVAGELIPEAPLVLDDALVRFDDRRLAAAMALLREESETRQILLFTCQQRELQYT